MSSADGKSGIVRIASQHDVPETIARLRRLFEDRGLTLFAHIDFAADAARAGLSMRPEQMLIFGNPKAGTPILQAAPTAGLDLPLKALVWQDPDGNTWLGYNATEYVLQRHGLPAALAGNIAAPIPLLESAARA
jgi:uncharacterized protein (DUF302 family)